MEDLCERHSESPSALWGRLACSRVRQSGVRHPCCRSNAFIISAAASDPPNHFCNSIPEGVAIGIPNREPVFGSRSEDRFLCLSDTPCCTPPLTTHGLPRTCNTTHSTVRQAVPGATGVGRRTARVWAAAGQRSGPHTHTPALPRAQDQDCGLQPTRAGQAGAPSRFTRARS